MGFVGVCLEWGSERKICYVVNVYGKHNLGEKRQTWGDLVMYRQGFGEGLWCVLGDFNSVCFPTERKGVSEADPRGAEAEATEFCGFIQNMSLVDLPLLGRKFTRVQPNGPTMSRLDRILVSDNWFESWGVSNLNDY